MNNEAKTLNPVDYMNKAKSIARNMKSLPHAIKDEAEGIALEALVRACQEYDAARTDAMGADGYITVKVRQALIDATRSHLGRGKSENKASVCSLSTFSYTDEEGESCEYNFADSAAPNPDMGLALTYALGKLQGMKEKERICVSMKAMGYKGKEISEQLGLTQGRVSQILKSVHKTLRQVA